MSNYCVDLVSNALLAPRPQPVDVSLPSHPKTEIRVIRFTRRIARQCTLGLARVPEWAVCDTIVNGSRRLTRRRGDFGGPVIRFQRSYPLEMHGKAPAGAFRGTVTVLGELTRRGCFALRLLAPARGGKKSGMVWDF